MLRILKRFVLYPLLIVAGLVCIVIIFLIIFTEPSNSRGWNADQVVLPYAQIKDNLITVKNIRNFSYTSTSTYTTNYYDKTFDLNKIKGVSYIVEPFSGFAGAAHTFLSFEFEGDSFLAVSVEIRKEVGESFSPLKGLFNNYEIMYVLADERDAVKLRSNYRKDLVYVYPVKTTKEKTQALFLDIIARVNELKDTPEFYNSAINNCTTNIASHVNTISPKRIPLSLALIMPADSDKLAYKLGLLDTDLPFEQAREKFLINERALKYADDPAFSVKIRQSE
ncbi:MAG: DUF4105 domain-containing protein [bacterium]|nr:DUF4105 domain-containing protein [bacterium]